MASATLSRVFNRVQVHRSSEHGVTCVVRHDQDRFYVAAGDMGVLLSLALQSCASVCGSMAHTQAVVAACLCEGSGHIHSWQCSMACGQVHRCTRIWQGVYSGLDCVRSAVLLLATYDCILLCSGWCPGYCLAARKICNIIWHPAKGDYWQDFCSFRAEGN